MLKNISKIAFAVIMIMTASNASAYDCTDAKGYVTSVRDSVLNILSSQDSDQAKHDKLDKIFRETADTEWMGKFVMGRNYAKLTPEQQKEYAQVYTNYLSANYVGKFKQYNGGSITINSVKPVNDDFNVDTTIQQNGKGPIDVAYRIRKAGTCFKVADIMAEGVSLINTQRQDFASAFEQRGYDGLIEVLKSKTDSSGADSQ